MPKRHPDDLFDDDKAYRISDLIELGYVKAKSTISELGGKVRLP